MDSRRLGLVLTCYKAVSEYEILSQSILRNDLLTCRPPRPPVSRCIGSCDLRHSGFSQVRHAGTSCEILVHGNDLLAPWQPSAVSWQRTQMPSHILYSHLLTKSCLDS